MTENEEAICDLRAKEDKREADGKEKGPKAKRSTAPKPEAEDDSEVEEERGLVQDDSSEYSDKVVEELQDTPESYPFQEKQPEVKNFI